MYILHILFNDFSCLKNPRVCSLWTNCMNHWFSYDYYECIFMYYLFYIAKDNQNTRFFFYDIHVHSQCIQKAQLLYCSMRKKVGNYWHAFIVFILAINSKTGLDSLNYWLLEKLNCVLEVSIFVYFSIYSNIRDQHVYSLGFYQSPSKTVLDAARRIFGTEINLSQQ